MYTVKELIEALKQCPEDYEVTCITDTGFIQSVAIDHERKTVTLFDY